MNIIMKKYISKEAIERRIYIYLCAFAFMNVISVAGANIFLGLVTAALLHRLVRYHEDAKEAFAEYKSLFCLLGLLLIALLLSLPNALEPGKGLTNIINAYIYRPIPLLAVLFCVHEKRRLINIALCMVLAAFLNNICAIGQGIMAYPLINGRHSGFMNIMVQGTLLSVLLPAAMVVFLSAKKAIVLWGSVVFGVVGLVAFVFNGTRGAWLAAVCSILVIAYLQVRDKRKYFAGMLVAGIIISSITYMVPDFQQRVYSIGNAQENSNTERRLLWQSAWHMFMDHPFTGVGYANFRTNYQKHYILPEAKQPYLEHAHNNFFHYLAETGILGLSALVALWGYLLAYAVKGWWAYREPVFLLMLAVLLGVIMHGLTEYTFGAAVTVKMFWLAMGLGFKYRI